MMSPANLVHSFSAKSTYDNISVMKSLTLKNNKVLSFGIGHSFISEQCYLVSPPSHRMRTPLFKQSLIGSFPAIDAYSSRAVSFNIRYKFTKHLNIAVLAHYNYVKWSSFIQLGVPINNIQLQIFYRFFKAN